MKIVAYLWVLLLGSLDPIFGQKLEVANREIQPQVIAVFPSADTLPTNLLRMYIHFSTPMKPFGNLEKIRLKDENGHEVMGAIFNNAFELWNHEQTQLTILLDPSRVKTGLISHEERGRALSIDKRYQLVIGALQDVNDRTTTPFTKSFTVGEEDLSPPNTDLWVFKTPEPESRDALVIKFPQLLDRLSLIQRLKLTDKEKNPIGGHVEIAHNESEWHFYPDHNWIPGRYILYVHSRLEDPSGNNLNGLFDHKVGSLKNAHEGKIETILINLTKGSNP